MAFGLRETRRRQRRARQRSLLKWVFVLAILLVAGYYAYETGSVLARGENSRLRGRIDELTAQVDELKAERSNVEAEHQAARVRVEELQDQYERDVPQGQAQELYRAVQAQLAEGVDPEQLEFVISQADNVENCDRESETKRFILRISSDRAANDAVTFANGTITVTGQGQAVVDDAGNPQTWFDTAQPVTLQFTRVGGDASEETGILPLHHRMVHQNSEWRFSATAEGPRGFVIVTARRCNYP